MILFLLKKKKFLIGFLFLITMLMVSIFHHGAIQQIRFQTDAKGNFLSAPPYPPLTVFILGSDRFGSSLGQMILDGAKYTIGGTLVVAFFRIVISLVISAFVYTIKPQYYRALKMIFEPFSIVPQTIIAFFILVSVLWMPMAGFHQPLWQRVLFEIFILVLIGIPSVTMQLTGELRLVMNEPFIEAAKTMGAGKAYIFLKHMIPHLYEKWILLFGQQFLQVLQLLAHLGVLHLFFGGTDPQYGNPPDPPKSISNEWSGLIGNNLSYIHVDQWMLLVPMAFFVLTAISVFFINDSLREFFQSKDSIRFTKED